MKDDRRRLAHQHLSDSLCLLTHECVLGVRHMMRMCIPSIRLSPTVSAELSMNLSSWLSSLHTHAQQPTACWSHPAQQHPGVTMEVFEHSCCIFLWSVQGWYHPYFHRPNNSLKNLASTLASPVGKELPMTLVMTFSIHTWQKGYNKVTTHEFM